MRRTGSNPLSPQRNKQMIIQNYVRPKRALENETLLREHMMCFMWNKPRKLRSNYQSVADHAAMLHISADRFKVIAAEELKQRDIVLSNKRHKWLKKISYGFGEYKIALHETSKRPSAIPPCPPMPAVIGPIRKPNPAYAASRLQSPI